MVDEKISIVDHKWLLDQNIPETICSWLEKQSPGLTVKHVKSLNLSRASDEEIFEYAQKEEYLTLTFDEDFADTRVFPLGSHCGIIRLRIWPTTTEEIQGALLRLLNQFSPTDVHGALVIVDRKHIRVRRAK